MLLDAELRGRLERLSLQWKRRVRGLWAGRHRSRQLGESLEFADYREYHPGDDFRRIDYNLWARLGVVLVRLFEAEDELPVQVIVDPSRSMEFGRKFETAQQLAAVVTYLALASGERVRLLTVPGPDRASYRGPWGRHPASWPRMEAWLEGLEPSGGTDLAGTARMMAGAGANRGPVVLISDLLAPAWDQALDVLGTLGGGAVMHVLSPAELEPDLTGDLTLRDIETGNELAVSMSGDAIDRYRERMDRFVADAGRRASRVRMDYVLVRAEDGAIESTLRTLVVAGLLR